MECIWRRMQKGWEPCGAHPLHNLVVMSLCLFGHPVATAEDATQPKADLRVLLRNRSIRQWHTLCVGQHVQPARCGRHRHLIAQWEVESGKSPQATVVRVEEPLTGVVVGEIQ